MTMSSAQFVNAVAAAERPRDVPPMPAADEVFVAMLSIDDVPATSTPTLIELILKDKARLHRLLRQAADKSALTSRFLAIAIVSFALYSIGMALTLDAAGQWPRLLPLAHWIDGERTYPAEFHAAPVAGRFLQIWWNGQALRLAAAYTIGLIAATGVCLPSLYFYGLLCGLRLTMIDVVLHALKGAAVTAIALIGILPIYAAFALGAIVLPASEPTIVRTLIAGLCLPFVAGLWGTRSLFVGFAGLCDTMPEPYRTNRACFLRRLVLSWCACYTAVAPVMIYSIWQHLGG